ncbi:ABC transporter substrate-binding protein [Nocardioides sp. cx-173]|uniref:ABC transporter substrate-binding protein n=1 Tax=Nocardioides sp. cx-173 TaxID=2898796 RepID=UPI001E5FA369|nr:ABC transporter substrate-binding protein [Nocardioides sp. cx-173]MCD4527060.1 ABC transporter substrate-binding protein [Nocardioides sp. cx-173]
MLALAASVSLAACGSDDEDDSGLTKVTLGVPLPAMEMGYGNLALAEVEGYFEDEGIKIEAQFVKDSSGVLQALSAGNIDIGSTNPDAALAARDKGQDVVMVYNSTRTSIQYYAVLPDSDIDSVEDLEGKTIGVSSLQSGAKTTSDLALDFAGIDPESDVTYESVGVGAPALDALQRGRIDVLMLWTAAYAEMESLGVELEYIKPESTENLFSTGFVVDRKWAEDNQEIIEGFGRAWARSTLHMINNPVETVEATWEQYPATKTGENDAEKLAKILEAGFPNKYQGDPNTYDKWGSYEEEAVELWTQVAVDGGLTESKVDAADAYTNDYVEAYNDFDRAELKG